jgi:ABC-type transport system involved in multi-copper enzyme maturation permease subunit
VKFREIFRFEFMCQARRVRTWLYFAALFVVAYLIGRNSIGDARNGAAFVNSPYVIALTTVISSLLWVVMAPAVAGSAAARDVQTRMHPLMYTTPVSKADYLGGRLLAALVLNALILLAVPAGKLLAMLLPGVEPEILGPSRPAAYLAAYVLMALPTVFIVTSIQFSLATLSGRSAASYLGSVLLFPVIGFIVAGVVANVFQMPTLGSLMDPIGLIVIGMLSRAWTPVEKNTILVGLESLMLASRLLWVGIALAVFAWTYRRFRFGDRAAATKSRRALRDDASTTLTRSAPISTPQVQRTFGFQTHVRQLFAIAWTSFVMIAKSAGGLVLPAAAAILAVLLAPALVQLAGAPLIPRTAHVITLLTAPIAANPRTPWVLIPLLIVYYAGELVWRERDARLSEVADATPAPEWVLFLGKFLGLSLVLAVWMALLTAAGVFIQVRLGYFDFEIGRYLQILFGLQLIDYLLFALLVLVVHAVVNQKHVGYLVALLAYGVIAFPSWLGIEHHLLIYGSEPGWSYSDIRGFGPSLGPWLWFKLYWAAWAILLAMVAMLLWARGREPGFGVRLRMAYRRLTRLTVWVAAAALSLILTLGGFIFYNTNVVNPYRTASKRTERGAEYERRYGKYAGIAQPKLTGTSLRVEIYPDKREMEIGGTYVLSNASSVAIDSIHLATFPGVETGAVSFNRPAAPALLDDDLGYRIYALEKPLQPGDSLQLSFKVNVAPHGFRNNGGDTFVFENGTYFTNLDLLPAIGYQRNRELNSVAVRKRFGLATRPAVPSLDDTEARRARVGGDRLTFEAIVGTSGDQTAIAPGALRRTWTEGGRRYFHYVADVPINNDIAVFSADYALHEEQWSPSAGSGHAVAIQIFHHSKHSAALGRMVASVRASLERYTREFGPYPHSYLRLIENPARGMGVESAPATLEYGERFSLLNPGDGPQDLDLVFAVVAHGVAHEWWGEQVAPADVEGSGLLNKSLETYSAMRVVEDTLGPDRLGRYLLFMREQYGAPSTRAAPPLLRATDSFAYSRKGPFALYALREYIGKDRVDEALRRLFEKHSSGAPPLPTSLDLYRELQAVTPDQFQSLLHDLFEKNTFWDLETERATAQQTAAGTWQVTLNVRVRKVVVDETGIETEMPMNDLVQVGVFGVAEKGEESPKPVYMQLHRIRSGSQTMTVTVPSKPTGAGIDPNNLLADRDPENNIKNVR